MAVEGAFMGHRPVTEARLPGRAVLRRERPETWGWRGWAVCIACALPGLLAAPPRAAGADETLVVSYRPLKPEIFFFSDVPRKLRAALLPLDLVGPPLTCFRPGDGALRSAMEAADEAVGRAESGPAEALGLALLRRGAILREAERIRCDAEYDRYEAILSLFEKGQVKQLPPRPACPDAAASIADWQRAAEVARDFPGRDQALYLAAAELELTYDFEKAAETADRVRTDHPDSPILVDSLLLAGGAWYEADSLDNARERLVSAAAADPARSVEPKYRIAWIDLLLSEYPAAVRGFLELCDTLRNDAGGMSAGQRRDIAREALGSVAWMLASDDWDGDGEEDTTRIAERTLGIIDAAPQDAEPLLAATLALLADSWGREVEDFVVLSRVYLERYPLAPGAPARHDALVQMLDRTASDRTASRDERCRAGGQALAERRRMVESYAEGGEWRRVNEGKPPSAEEVDELLHLAMTESAVLLHRKAQNIRTMEVSGGVRGASRSWYCRAQRAYIELLDRFPDSPQQCNARRSLGDTAFFGTWNEAEAVKWLAPVRDDQRCSELARTDAAELAGLLEERVAKASGRESEPAPCSSPDDESDEHGFCIAEDYDLFTFAPGTRSREQGQESLAVDKVVRRSASELSRCAQLAATAPGTRENRLVRVALSIQATGRAVVHVDGGGSEALARCIGREVSSWRFPIPDAAPLDLEFKIALMPE